MEKGKKRIRICLVCVVLTAVLIGLFYYYYQLQGESDNSQGTLITHIATGIEKLWQR